MKFKALILLPLMITALAGCGKKASKLSAEEACKKYVNDPTNLVCTTGDLVYPDTTKRLNYGENLVGVKKYSATMEDGTVFEPEVEWTLDKHWTKKGYTDSSKKTDPTRYLLDAEDVYTADTEYDSELKLTFKWNGAEASASYKAHMSHIELTPMTIKEYRDGLADGSIAKTTYVKLYGYITGAHDKEHEYSGVYMQDGEWAVQLYAGNLGSCWTNNQLEVGDLVYAVGNLSEYHGLQEIYCATVDKVPEADKASVQAAVATPTYYTIAAGEFTAAKLAKRDGSLVEMNGLTFNTIGKTATSAATNVYNTSEQYTYVWFKDSENKDVSMYITYHIANREALKTMFAGWECGTTVVNFKGHLSWYDAPMLMPVLGTSCFTVA